MTLLVNFIPDSCDIGTAESWVQHQVARAKSTVAADVTPDSLQSWTAPSCAPSPLGPWGTPAWRCFALGLLTADWASYDHPADRADFIRLAYLLSLFPKGFRLWTHTMPDGTLLPVGYMGWYPITPTLFKTLYDAPESLSHRGLIVPLTEMPPEKCVYLFNYSVIPALIKTPLSAMMIKRYAQDLHDSGAKAMAAVTVSPHGIRVAQRFGLSYRGDMHHGGEAESVYAAWLPTAS